MKLPSDRDRAERLRAAARELVELADAIDRPESPAPADVAAALREIELVKLGSYLRRACTDRSEHGGEC